MSDAETALQAERAADEQDEQERAALLKIVYDSGAFMGSPARHTSTHELVDYIQAAGFTQTPRS